LRFLVGLRVVFDSPDLFQEIVKDRILFLELGADEGKEVLSIKMGFGSFEEVYHQRVIGVGANFATGVGCKLCRKAWLPWPSWKPRGCGVRRSRDS